MHSFLAYIKEFTVLRIHMKTGENKRRVLKIDFSKYGKHSIELNSKNCIRYVMMQKS